jgi:hypothetical protein
LPTDVYTANGRDFSSAEEMDEALRDQWTTEYLNSGSASLTMAREDLKRRFGRSVVRQVIREKLIRLRKNALDKLPDAVQKRIDELDAHEAQLPTDDELNRRQQILASRFIEELHNKIDDIRPSRSGCHQGLALVDGTRSVAEITTEWDREFQEAVSSIHVFLGDKLVARQAHVLRHFEACYKKDKQVHESYVPNSVDELIRVAAASLNVADLSQDVDCAQAESTALLVEWLSKRFKDGLAGFLDYSIFESYVNAVLVTATEPIIGYIRKYACLCGYIFNTMLWDIRHLPYSHLYGRLKDHLRRQFQAIFRSKLDAVVQAVKDELRRAFRQRRDLHGPLWVPVLSSTWETLKQEIIARIGNAMEECLKKLSWPDGDS